MTMDHTYIEEHQIADRYVMGTLPAEEAERFENHYLSCPECLDRLDLTESVQRGFQRMATQDATRLATARQLALVAWLARLGRERQIAVLLAALLVLAVLPAGLAFRGIAGRERELAQARSALEQERRGSAMGSRSAAEAGKLRSELAAMQHDLAGEREARVRASEQLAQVQQAQANVPSLFLDSVRGGGPSANEPPQGLHRPEGAGRISLFLQVGSAFQPPFRAILRDARGREVLRVEDLRPNERDDLSLGLPASLVPTGEYSILVESLAPGRKPAAAGRFAFRVLPPA